jgi:hypothetical protein
MYNKRHLKVRLRTAHYLWRGVSSKINVFLGEMFADPTIKKSTTFFSQPQISIKNIYPPLAKNVTKEYHSVVTHFQYHFCDTSSITACAIFFPFSLVPPSAISNDRSICIARCNLPCAIRILTCSNTEAIRVLLDL